MPQEFLTFQKFNNIESANTLADFLLENNIVCYPWKVFDTLLDILRKFQDNDKFLQ